MSNSSLVNYTKISPNSTNPRNQPISKITIHHVAGNASVESLGNTFAKESRQASSNYGIGTDGRVGMYVEECNRSWCSSSRTNDHMAVTIEVANDGGAPNWHVSDTALAKLIDLCVDICQRNGIEKLNYTGDTSGNLTMHKWFAATSCPGPYLESKFPYIAEEVNKRLTPAKDTKRYRVTLEGVDSDCLAELNALAKENSLTVTAEEMAEEKPAEPAPAPVEPVEWIPSVGDIVYFKGGLQYSQSNGTTGSQRAAGQAKITKVFSGKHPYHLVKTGSSGPYGWVDRNTFEKA